eukprot:8405539-Alexandrium_andersonii.AAC.1
MCLRRAHRPVSSSPSDPARPMTPNPQARLFRAESKALLGLRARAAHHGLCTDCGLPPDYALDWIARSHIIVGPRK